MNILSTYIYKQYLINVKKEAYEAKRKNNLMREPATYDEWGAWIYYLSMAKALRRLDMYLMDNYPDEKLEWYLDRHEKDSLRYANTPAHYILSENESLHTICYNAELLYELDLFEQQISKQEIIHILTKVLQIPIPNHELFELINS